jgi:antitoxin FitA
VASITIRDLDEQLKSQLRIRAAQQGHSMEEEVRQILRASHANATGKRGDVSLAAAIRKRFSAVGGVSIEVPSRGPIRKPPKVAR